MVRIEESFDVFDHEQNKTVDARELGTIIRSLGCYPNEAELQDMMQVCDSPASLTTPESLRIYEEEGFGDMPLKSLL